MEEEWNSCKRCGLPVRQLEVALEETDKEICQCSDRQETTELFETTPRSSIIPAMCSSCFKPLVESRKPEEWQQVLSSNLCLCEKPRPVDNKVVNYLIYRRYLDLFGTESSGGRKKKVFLI